jgi:asparagine synthase (glutamine-hydrolysing)
MGDFGNYTFSAEGNWGFLEYFYRLRWRQLYLALQGLAGDNRPLHRRFLTSVLMPLLPKRLFNWQRRLRGMPDVFELASPLRHDFAESSGALARARRAGLPLRRSALGARWFDYAALQGEDMGEHSDLMHGFEQIYGIGQRDPTAYRPFAEFCFGLPTDLFLRDGQSRWLAREMARGIMPEAQRLNPGHGVHNADWHVKLGRQRAALLEEIDRLAATPRLRAIFDFEKVRRALEDWPETSQIPHERRLPLEAATARVVAMARYVNFVEGRNQ